ncbi:MAG: DUF2877 domain-containing protein [Pseudonocardia sp.]|nr:DUF2877 domain-containing protein [Pseudonocardia sp.]
MTGEALSAEQRAVSIGYLVPHEFAGVVHSVFATACNLAVAGRLVTVHDTAMSHLPTSVRLMGWAPRARVGQPARCQAGLLGFGPHRLDLRGAPVWSPSAPPTRINLAAALSLADEVALARLRHLAGVGGPAPGLAERAEDLRGWLLSRSEARPPSVLLRLIGFGPGLTPAGDDVLVGLMSVLYRAGGESAAARAVRAAVAPELRRQAHRSTDVGAHYLRLAADGHFGEPLLGLVDALVGGHGRAVVLARTRDALRVGASSGADAVGGILLGLSALGSFSSPAFTVSH